MRVVKYNNEVPQRSCGLSALGDTQSTRRASPGQPVLAGSTASRAGLCDLQRCLLPLLSPDDKLDKNSSLSTACCVCAVPPSVRAWRAPFTSKDKTKNKLSKGQHLHTKKETFHIFWAYFVPLSEKGFRITRAIRDLISSNKTAQMSHPIFLAQTAASSWVLSEMGRKYQAVA